MPYYRGQPSPRSDTVTVTHDLDPNRRKVRTFRHWLRQARDIIHWEYRKATGNPLPHESTVTLYDVQFAGL